MVRHQKRRAIRADNSHWIALSQIAKIIRRDATHLSSIVIFGHPLYRERQIIVVRLFTVTRACDRVKSNMMRPVVGIRARRNDADRLSLEHRKRQGAEIENDVAY